MKYLFIPLLLLLLNALNAATVYSVQSGNWSSAQTWSTASVPVPTDSVVIRHSVTLDQDITIDETGALLIEVCARLCGNFSITGHFRNYGGLYIHAFHITCCESFNFSTGDLVFAATSSMEHGYFLNQGGSTCGGCYNGCSIPRASCVYEVGLSDLTTTNSLMISPNPSTGLVQITVPLAGEVFVYDLQGRLLYKDNCNAGIATTLNLQNLLPGNYIVQFQGEQNRLTRKLVITQ